jgi:integration host factor subunit beta
VALEREIAMTKLELVQKLVEANRQLYRRDVEAIVTLFFEQIAAALRRGDRVELRGFGAFAVKHRGPRAGRNPRNGASVAVPDKHVPFFRAGKLVCARLNLPD